MSYSLETVETAPSRPQTQRTSQAPAGKICATSHCSDARLWKLSSTAISPVGRGFETGLFLIAGSFGIGATVYSVHHLIAFIHNDSLTRTITGLLQ